MTPTELRLFTASEQTLLVSTEPARLKELSEDELADLLPRVRRLRNKHRDQHRTQARRTKKTSGKRAGAATANERSLRQAEVAEDALSRVARYLSVAARHSADELKAERIAAARAVKAGRKPASATKTRKKPANAKTSKRSKPRVTGGRKGSASARTRRSQAKTDSRGPKG